MSRPPLPWWTAHVIGLVLCQAAFWFGFWRLYVGKSFIESMVEATTGPADEMAGLMSPCTIVVLFSLWFPVIIAGWDSRWRWRRILVVLVYAVLAAYWCVAVEFRATPLDL